VQTTRLGDLVRDRRFNRFTLIYDIEGVEYDLVCQEANVLKMLTRSSWRLTKGLSGRRSLTFMMTTLAGLGFKLIEETEFVVVPRQ
jgi:hypothetical protein